MADQTSTIPKGWNCPASASVPPAGGVWGGMRAGLDYLLLENGWGIMYLQLNMCIESSDEGIGPMTRSATYNARCYIQPVLATIQER